ncbi:DUF2510 domain-containing protein [Gordonia sp. FQ]|uniref:DUF2510 domain-containing protein n=1 Tax=Gordonia sp. FQ TaxID=3446634 RepID=UPI003F83C1C7
MAETNAGWYDDGSGTLRWWDGQRWTEQTQEPPKKGGVSGMLQRIQDEASAGARPRPAASPAAAASPAVPAGAPGAAPTPATTAPATGGMSYVVLQVVLKEKFFGTGSGNLTELENAINRQAALGYRLHTISTAAAGSKGLDE